MVSEAMDILVRLENAKEDWVAPLNLYSLL